MTETPDSSLFASPLHVINIGADLFADAIDSQGAHVTRVTWQPSPGNSDAALSVLLDDPRVDQANQEAAQRMIAARPRLVAVRPAGWGTSEAPEYLPRQPGPPSCSRRLADRLPLLNPWA